MGSLGSVIGAFAFAASAFAFAMALSFAAAAVTAVFSEATCAGGLETFGFDVNLSINIFVPAPIAAPESAFTTLLVVEFGLVVFGLIVCLEVVDGDVVMLVGVFDVVLVTEGLEPVDDVKLVLGAPVCVVTDGLEPLPVDVRLDAPPEIDGDLLTPRMMLSNGARSSPFASGSCLLDVRFFRIAMSYPVFFTSDVRPAMLVTGLNFAVLGSVLGGAFEVAF